MIGYHNYLEIHIICHGGERQLIFQKYQGSKNYCIYQNLEDVDNDKSSKFYISTTYM